MTATPLRSTLRPPRHLLPALLIAAAGLCAAHAQAAGKGAPVLEGRRVTEQALVDALVVDPPAGAADGQPASRGIRPSLVQTNPALKPQRHAAAASTGKASLLITFATGSAELTPEGEQVLDTVAKALQSDRLAGFSFRVEGHADPRGGEDLNQKLSAERAASVVSYLTTKHGIAADRLAPVGKGASELMNASRPDAPENRRVTIVTNR